MHQKASAAWVQPTATMPASAKVSQTTSTIGGSSSTTTTVGSPAFGVGESLMTDGLYRAIQLYAWRGLLTAVCPVRKDHRKLVTTLDVPRKMRLGTELRAFIAGRPIALDAASSL